MKNQREELTLDSPTRKACHHKPSPCSAGYEETLIRSAAFLKSLHANSCTPAAVNLGARSRFAPERRVSGLPPHVDKKTPPPRTLNVGHL